MKKINQIQKSTPKSFGLDTKFKSNYERRSNMRSEQSKLIDLNPLNQTILLDCPRREKID